MCKKNTEFIDFLNQYPISTRHAFDIARVNRTTFRRWLSGESRIPPATLELLRLHACGEPPSTHFEWQGWCFTQGKLFTPSNRGFSPVDIVQIPELYRDRAILHNIQQNFTLQHKFDY
jgi:hypothetical protein